MKPRRRPPCATRTSIFIVTPLPDDTCPPGQISPDHVALLPKNRPGTITNRACSALAGTPSRRVEPVAAFVVASASGTTRTRPCLCTRANDPATALQQASLSRCTIGRLLLAAHSHTAAFESPGRPPAPEARDQAPGTAPAATVLPGLVMIFVQSVTSLAGVTPRIIAVCLRLPPEHSFDERQAKWPWRLTISAGRNEKHPLTHRR